MAVASTCVVAWSGFFIGVSSAIVVDWAGLFFGGFFSIALVLAGFFIGVLFAMVVDSAGFFIVVFVMWMVVSVWAGFFIVILVMTKVVLVWSGFLLVGPGSAEASPPKHVMQIWLSMSARSRAAKRSPQTMHETATLGNLNMVMLPLALAPHTADDAMVCAKWLRGGWI